MNKQKTGLAVGTFAAVMHVGWSILVMLGLAQPFYNWALSLHAIEVPITIGPMSIGGAIMLVIVAFVMGNIVGWIFAAVWNKVNR